MMTYDIPRVCCVFPIELGTRIMIVISLVCHVCITVFFVAFYWSDFCQKQSMSHNCKVTLHFLFGSFPLVVLRGIADMMLGFAFLNKVVQLLKIWLILQIVFCIYCVILFFVWTIVYSMKVSAGLVVGVAIVLAFAVACSIYFWIIVHQLIHFWEDKKLTNSMATQSIVSSRASSKESFGTRSSFGSNFSDFNTPPNSKGATPPRSDGAPAKQR